jgi:cholest-4-en-3-one 26-monooxygenase
MYFRRNATKDAEVGGEQIKAGDKISLWYISANRDEAVFDDPFRFDITRDPNNHLAFGGGGPHFCLGAQLARLEIRVMFEELATRFPKLQRLEEPERLRSNFIAGIKHLPVRLSA